jgi:tetratricopeptide (TPR) repeat protein
MVCSRQTLVRAATWAILGSTLIPGLFCAPEEWIKIETPHFELYTTAGEKKGREAILYFEQVRSFFLQASPSKRAAEFPVRIVAFRSESQYKPYRMNGNAIAFYAPGRSRDYIVMQDISGEHYPVAIHEYTHMVVQHAGLKLPVWLNEGWADLYSTLSPKGSKALVGNLLPGGVQTLAVNKWIPLSVLASVDQNSPMYNEKDKAGIFYAESWLLVHMLYLSADYRPDFSKFVLAIANGQDTAQAFQSVYGKGLKQVTNDLERYSKSDRFVGALFDVKLEKSAEDPHVSEATAFDSGLVLADLLALVHKPEEARRAYGQLATDNPDRPEVQESLGYLALQAGDQAAARQYFSKAFTAGTKNAQMCVDYAQLEWQAAPADLIAILRRAVELKPDYVAARLQLGLALTNHENYTEAIDQLHRIPKIEPDQAPSYFLALAYSNLRTGHPDEARKDAESAKKWAKTPAQTEEAETLLRSVDESKAGPPRGISAQPEQASINNTDPGRPTLRHSDAPASEIHEAAPRNPFVKREDQVSHVEGLAQRLDCEGQSARFQVLVGKATMVFEILDPSSVLIKHSGEAHHDFTCGPQQPFPVAVDYAVKPDPKKGTAGIVRELDF